MVIENIRKASLTMILFSIVLQHCCGDDCKKAGASRDGLGGSVMSSMVLRDGDGNIVAPHQVGTTGGDQYRLFLEDHGLNSSSTIKARSASGTPVYKIGYPSEKTNVKRACNKFNEGSRYTSTGELTISGSTQETIANNSCHNSPGVDSYVITNYICGDGSELENSNQQYVTRTTTFGASVGDPFGIVTASTQISFEETAGQSTTYKFTLKEGQCGHINWTPFFDCIKGTLTGCGEGGDQTGEVCTAKRLGSGDIDGAYTFVVTD
jgi:hypothetical protein